ncbi:MAG: superoxide dismutase family protein [Firmicutes bacterium HGW-Firmicutes-16]|nr:MAG: superoxide dismutase family protein [Firmicutes bacterium HGW-Firmicutes-16]
MFSAYQLSDFLKQQPSAYANISGSSSYPNISGIVGFYQFNDGVLLAAEVEGLPNSKKPCESSVFGFHIHEGSECSGNAEDPFANTGGHYNPNKCPHPAHSGDLPPLFGNQGYAFMAVFTNRFSVDEVINRTVVIHASLDDFSTQPAGNSGKKIACGRIIRMSRLRS